MKKPIIAVDADDTIFDENSAIIRFHNQTYNTSHTLEDYMAPGVFGTFWEHIWKTDKKETLRRYDEFIEHKLKYNLPPLPGALDTLKELKKHYVLEIVTARGERSIKMTHEALQEHYPKIFNDVHFSPLWGAGEEVTKAQICQEIGAEYLIDDSYEHCMLAAEAGLEALLFGKYGWNQTQQLAPNMRRVSNWIEVQEYFNAKN